MISLPRITSDPHLCKSFEAELACMYCYCFVTNVRYIQRYTRHTLLR